MTPERTINLLRALFVILSTFVGFAVAEVWFHSILHGLFAGLAFGLAVILADLLLKGIRLRTFSAATAGLLVGVLFARLLLLSDILRFQDEEHRWVLSLAAYLACGYIGMMLAIRSNRDDFALLIPYVRFRSVETGDPPLLLDSSAAIDGRLLDLATAGVTGHSIVIPRFILNELQTLADSADPLKRERGRRGLEQLGRLRELTSISVTLQETDAAERPEPTDAALVRLARALGGRILTNDSALTSVARLQGVRTLNLTELERALRPRVHPGDQLRLVLSREGREPHQAVGYLEDGTMIVVNNARPLLGKTVDVTIASVVPTSAGRLVFADPSEKADRREPGA